MTRKELKELNRIQSEIEEIESIVSPGLIARYLGRFNLLFEYRFRLNFNYGDISRSLTLDSEDLAAISKHFEAKKARLQDQLDAYTYSAAVLPKTSSYCPLNNGCDKCCHCTPCVYEQDVKAGAAVGRKPLEENPNDD